SFRAHGCALAEPVVPPAARRSALRSAGRTHCGGRAPAWAAGRQRFDGAGVALILSGIAMLMPRLSMQLALAGVQMPVRWRNARCASSADCRASGGGVKPATGFWLRPAGASNDGKVLVARVATTARISGGRGLCRRRLAGDPDRHPGFPVLPHSRLVGAAAGA